MEEDGNLRIGTRLGEFEIRGLIGTGKLGVVYRAFDHELEREVAVREYLPAALASRAEDGQVQVRERVHAHAFSIGLQHFLWQAQLLARFDHPALVKVFRYWEDHGTAYMVMPFYAGQTLAQALRAMPAPPTEAWLMGVLVPLLGALDSLHSQQILHRHVAPDNIRLLRNGRPVLLEPDSAQDGLQPGYAPIEQVTEGPDLRQGPWTDLHALAAVVHAAMTGKPPPSARARAVQDDMEPLADVAARLAISHGQHYHPAFLAAWQQALSLRPANRPQNVQALMQPLGLIAAPTPAATTTATSATPAVNALAPLEAPRPRPYGVLAVVLAGLLGTGVVGYRLYRTAPGNDAPRLPPVVIDEPAERPVPGASAVLSLPALVVRDPSTPVLASAKASAAASKANARASVAASVAASGVTAVAAPVASRVQTLPPASTPVAPLPSAGSGSTTPRTLDALCGARFFLAKELCIQNACETAEFAQLASCVDLRRKAEDERMRKLHTDG